MSNGTGFSLARLRRLHITPAAFGRRSSLTLQTMKKIDRGEATVKPETIEKANKVLGEMERELREALSMGDAEE